MEFPKTDYKVLAVVKFNDGEALVLDKQIELTYFKFGNDIIGTDGIFINCYYGDRITPGFSAFGGRKFDITLHDGEVINCYGQWWSGTSKKALEIIGETCVRTTANSLTDLQECYVYYGYTAIKSKFDELRASYGGVVYEYFDYDFISKSLKKYHGKLKKLIGRVDKDKMVVDEHGDIYLIRQILGKTYYRFLSKCSKTFYPEYLPKQPEDEIPVNR